MTKIFYSPMTESGWEKEIETKEVARINFIKVAYDWVYKMEEKGFSEEEINGILKELLLRYKNTTESFDEELEDDFLERVDLIGDSKELSPTKRTDKIDFFADVFLDGIGELEEKGFSEEEITGILEDLLIRRKRELENEDNLEIRKSRPR